MNNAMDFLNTFEEFLSHYSFKDREEVYTNGSELIQTFRVMQGYEHFSKQIREDAYQQGRVNERRKIIEIIDSADDNVQAMYLLGQYIISEDLKEEVER